ncbi:NAD-dependent epimerase/dehydratase family protein [candidate division WOR-3 bacterium]|uniref:NAD-dependent epimerase/dehydratase family protein n=1 Tax=candidate division WOR-3 bacterium TaxID=2052148 RepID=A0A9D5K9Z5_UNCW3|nr:NAD-dependent epimerase/dehydratase family protein [candidate division WOR-3 bacterium]MBD3365131.1 NAD-dependent epimerase/dehydratase family protein [candidate division WOR-3 bacterium]
MARKRILIIGGTRFLGRHLVDAALESRCKVTLFNRGKTNPDLFPNVETIKGDRATDLGKLGDRKWDVVIDTCGYVPRVVAKSVKNLESRVGQYVFISTIGVYNEHWKTGLDENSALFELPEPTEQVTEQTYGPLKALCEKEVLRVFPEGNNGLIVRPGLIVGPWDPTDRFTYWVERVERGGDVLTPGPPERPVQFIDVRDLAEWIVWMVKKARSGIYNAVGPHDEMTMTKFLNICKEVTASDAGFTWVSEEYIEKEEIPLPVWVPKSYLGYATADNRKFSDLAKLRDAEETVADTQLWFKTRRGEEPMKAGLTPEKEAELLKKWHLKHT